MAHYPAEIARTAQRVKHYAASGLIHADEGGGSGPGRYRRYNDESVYHAALVQEMKLSGVGVKAIHNAMAVMKEQKPPFLVVGCRNSKAQANLIGPAQFVFNVAKIFEKVRR